MKLPFFVRRPWLVIRGTTIDRDRPDLERLAAIDDPEDFVWAVLPHAARSFATSILVLPERRAWAAAIAYLYCRMLDTYEDLFPDDVARAGVLRSFGNRFAEGSPASPPLLPTDRVVDDRDRVHVLVVERCAVVDAAYAELPADERVAIADLVRDMATGMAWASERFRVQGGVLVSPEQRAEYCNHVIGGPARYVVGRLLDRPVSTAQSEDIADVAVMIQLANITRDLEKDLQRGIAYHPSLSDDLGSTPTDAAARERVRRVREALMVEAMERIPAYHRLANDVAHAGVSQARGAAVLMLLFTDRYYRACAVRAGHRAWKGVRWTGFIYALAIASTVSARVAERVFVAVEREFLAAAERIAAARAR